MTRKEDKTGNGFVPAMVAAVTAGGLIGALGIPPFPYLARGAAATVELYREKTQERPNILGPIVYPGTGVVKDVEEEVAPGLTLIEGIFPEGTQVRLYDERGKVLHKWVADFFQAWPDAEKKFPKSRIPKSRLHYFIQGLWPLKDGSVIINFGDLGAVRLDKCSNVLWRSDRPTHHSVTPTGRGTFWIPGHIPVSHTPKDYLPRSLDAKQIQVLLGHQFKDYHNSAVLFDEKGRILKEFSVLESVYDAGLENALYSSMQEVVVDPTHLNDIEIVTPELAKRFASDIETGDLLISLREMNMLAVLDKDDGHLKWHRQGPWVRQHDIDITEDGKIEIFNNRSKLISRTVDTSQILSFDPADNSVKVLFPVGKEDRFFTHIMGSHQKLANGNRLIAETVAGRVFEVTPQGKIVWDFRMPYDDKAASLLTNAMRIPGDYFNGGIPACSEEK